MKRIRSRFFLVLIVIFTVFSFAACTKSSKNSSNKNNEEKVPKEIARILGIVKNVDTVNDKLYVFDIEGNELVTLIADNSINMADKYGEPITLDSFRLGDMVKTKYDKNSLIPEYIQITAETWEHSNINNVTFNAEEKTIQRGNDTYEYTDELMVLFKGKPINIEQLTKIDEVTLKGYKNKVWVVNLENGHGKITLVNQDFFVGGTLEIGSHIIETITDPMTVPVPVGVHKIVVDKENIPIVEKEVMVDMDMEVIIDLKQETPKQTFLTLNLSHEEASVYINGQRYEDLTKPIVLAYGEYTIVAELEGYVKYEDTITLNQPIETYDINLEKSYHYMHVDYPQSVDLYLNGEYIGKIPTSAPVKPGMYTVTLRKDGYYSKNHTIEVLDNGQDSFFQFPELIKKEQEEDDEGEGTNEDELNAPTEDVFGE